MDGRTLYPHMIDALIRAESRAPRMPVVRFSEHATSLPKEPTNDYMRQMVAHVGVKPVPACFQMQTPEGPVFVAHPSMRQKLLEKLQG